MLQARTPKQIRQLLILSLIIYLFSSHAMGQDTKRIINLESDKINRSLLYPDRVKKNDTWTPEFSYSLSDSLNPSQPITYLQGICWTGSEYWIGIWGGSFQGSIFRVDAQGRRIGGFSIIGVTGITGLTRAGDNVYAVNESDKIYVIHKDTRQRLSTITINGNARPTFLTYSPEIDNGNGGFFAGNFELKSPLYEISMQGELLKIVPPEVHRQRVMTGAAYDTLSTGGPYLWVFNQEEPGNPSEAVITQLDASTGQYTGIYKDVTEDYGDQFSAGGGLFIAESVVNGKLILGGVLQSSPSDFLIGYDLNFQVPRVDASLNNVIINEGLTQVPGQHRPEFSFSGNLTNRGIDTLNQLQIKLEIKKENESTVLFSDQVDLDKLAYLSEASFELGPWDGTESGKFLIETQVLTGQQQDESQVNNTFVQELVIGDSIMALDDGRDAGVLGLGFGAENKTYFGQVFPAKEELFDYLTSITFKLRNPKEGDQIQASVFDIDPETERPIGVPVASTITYQITKMDEDSGVVLTLPLADGPYPIFPGKFFVAVKEGERPLSLVYSDNIYRVGERLVRTDTVIAGTPFDGDWVEIEEIYADPVKPALMIRPNFGPCVPTYMTGSISVTGDRGSGDGTATVEVEGAGGLYSYQWNDPASQTNPTATGLEKDQEYSVTITDTTGCTLTLISDPIPNLVSIDDLPGAGIVSLKIHPNPAYEDLVVHFELDRPDQLEVNLINLKGQYLFTDEKTGAFQYQRRIYIKDYAKGVYILEVKTSRGSFRERIMLR
ncbi:MAG: T9SS type A sorting domain-containing protein [Bacteroidota bacterium]